MAPASSDARVGLVLDPRFEEHRTGQAHPERSERLGVVRRRLESDGLAARCVRVEPVAALTAAIERIHAPDYVRRLIDACAAGETVFDSMDTEISSESERVARLAAGTLTSLAREIAGGALDRGFAAVRPPGHHAEHDLSMGFCLYNSVAVAARALVDEGLASRVLIVDWDVHHGNGTQHLFEDSADVFYFSVHQWPLYPGTGARTERGRGAGEGATLNCPVPPGTGDAPWLETLRGELAQAMDDYRPDFVFVSAGFDAHRNDPLAQLDVSTDAFAAATRILLGIARKHAGGRMVTVLEGGYDLESLADCVSVHVETLLSDRPGNGAAGR